MSALWPITMPGMPEKLNPATLNSHVQCSPSWYQMLGIEAERWGSLASIGLPVAVCSPAITHELEPMPDEPSPSSRGNDLMAADRSASAAAAPSTVLRSAAATAVRS